MILKGVSVLLTPYYPKESEKLMKIQINVPFYKVIVLSVDVFETTIIDEKNFSNFASANAYKNSLDNRLISILVEV